MPGEEISCPVCGRAMEVRFCVVDREEGSLWVASARCACGHAHRDAEPLGVGLGRQVLSISVRGADDLDAGVVRGPQASVLIPEWGLRLDPGSDPQAFTSNVEGVLVRFQEAVRRARVLFADAESRRSLDRLDGLLERARCGKEEFTMVLEDPEGRSRLGGEAGR